MKRRGLLAASGTGLLAVSGCIQTVTDYVPSAEPSVEEVKENATPIEYDDLYRNIESYEGEYVHYEQLRISDILSGEGQKEYLFVFPGGGFIDDRVLYGTWDGSPFKDGDTVEVWGVVEGLETVSLLGQGDTSVPNVRVVEMELLED